MTSFKMAINYVKFFRIFCIFPIQFNDKLKKYEKQPLKWAYLINLIILFSVHIMTIFALIRNFPEEKINLGLRLIQQLASLSVIGTCYFMRGTLVKTINLFAKIDDSLIENGVVINYKFILYFVFSKHLIIGICIISANLICNTNALAESSCTVYTVEHFLSFEILTEVSTALFLFFLLSEKIFQILNRSIINLILCDKTSNKNNKISRKNKTSQEILKLISELHFNTVNMTNMACKTYSSQLLIIIFGFTLIRSVANIYQLVNNDDGNYNMVKVYVDFFWLLPKLIDILITFLIATKVETTSNKSAKIANVINCKGNAMLEAEKNMFLLQTLHQRISLNVGNVYSLNNSTYLELGGSAVTYIILLQGLGN